MKSARARVDALVLDVGGAAAGTQRSQTMDPRTIERVLSCQRLPSLPAVALRVIELTTSKDVRIQDIADTITNDQGLSSKVLRTVNSSFYALRKPCSTINGAIVMLGLNAVKTLALGFSLASSIAKKGNDGFDYQSYWRRSLLSGVGAKCVAVEARCGNDEECFLGGLLQDVGMVALFQSLAEEYLAVLGKAGSDHRQLVKHEMSDLELSHAEIGAMLVSRWKLPPELVMPVRFHERPTAAPPEYLRICQAVALGNIVHDVMVAAEPGVALKRFYTRAQEWMSLSNAQCDAILKRTQEGSKDIGRLLDIDAASLPSTADLHDRATAQLSRITIPLNDNDAGMNDPVTGLPNRDSFNRNITTAYELANGGASFAVAMFAIDGFAQFEAMNPLVGQGLMAQVASRLADHFHNAGGALFRFDDYRFAALLPKCERLHAARLAEEGRALIAQGPIHIHPPGLTAMSIDATLSAGVACVDGASIIRLTNADALIDTTLRALASAQSSGHNMMRVYAPKVAA